MLPLSICVAAIAMLAMHIKAFYKVITAEETMASAIALPIIFLGSTMATLVCATVLAIHVCSMATHVYIMALPLFWHQFVAALLLSPPFTWMHFLCTEPLIGCAAAVLLQCTCSVPDGGTEAQPNLFSLILAWAVQLCTCFKDHVDSEMCAVVCGSLGFWLASCLAPWQWASILGMLCFCFPSFHTRIFCANYHCQFGRAGKKSRVPLRGMWCPWCSPSLFSEQILVGRSRSTLVRSFKRFENSLHQIALNAIPQEYQQAFQQDITLHPVPAEYKLYFQNARHKSWKCNGMDGQTCNFGVRGQKMNTQMRANKKSDCGICCACTSYTVPQVLCHSGKLSPPHVTSGTALHNPSKPSANKLQVLTSPLPALAFIRLMWTLCSACMYGCQILWTSECMVAVSALTVLVAVVLRKHCAPFKCRLASAFLAWVFSSLLHHWAFRATMTLWVFVDPAFPNMTCQAIPKCAFGRNGTPHKVSRDGSRICAWCDRGTLTAQMVITTKRNVLIRTYKAMAPSSRTIALGRIPVEHRHLFLALRRERLIKHTLRWTVNVCANFVVAMLLLHVEVSRNSTT